MHMVAEHSPQPESSTSCHQYGRRDHCAPSPSAYACGKKSLRALSCGISMWNLPVLGVMAAAAHAVA